jgi:hypothetical protein
LVFGVLAFQAADPYLAHEGADIKIKIVQMNVNKEVFIEKAARR